MRAQSIALTAAAAAALCGFTVYQAPKHFNPMIDLHIAKKPVLGLYAPANPRMGRGGAGRGGAPGGAGGVTPAGAPANAAPATPPVMKTPAQLVSDAFAYKMTDFIFDGSMEGDFQRGYDAFLPFVNAVIEQGAVDKTGGYAHLHHPIVVKTHKISDDTIAAKANIAKQLDLGVSTIAFVEMESATELKTGLNAMRYKSQGGTRPDGVGLAPKMWGMSDADYKKKADLWPLNPNGELTNWTIVETPKGLDNVREIAATKGISVLLPGAGTLRGLYTKVDPATGERKFDEVAWEAAIQKVLAACKEFNVPCGFPANDPATVELRSKQGFTMFIAGWGENGFKAMEYGRKQAGR